MSNDETLRDVRGKWLPSTPSPNPNGRPRREIEQEYLDTTIGAVSLDDWREIVGMFVRFAKSGSIPAAVWLGNYVIGPPQTRISVSRGVDDPLSDLTDDQINQILTSYTQPDSPALPEGNHATEPTPPSGA